MITIPAGGMPADALPPPSQWEILDETVQKQSDLAAGFVFTHIPDPDLQPKAYTLVWNNAGGAVANAIRAHYRDHARQVWEWPIPRTATKVRVRWAGPPSTRWANGTQNTTIRGVLELALAYE